MFLLYNGTRITPGTGNRNEDEQFLSIKSSGRLLTAPWGFVYIRRDTFP
jgi:hypothetical protein